MSAQSITTAAAAISAVVSTDTSHKKKKPPAAIDYLNSFIKRTKLLTLDMANRFPRDPVAQRIKSRVMAASGLDPLFVMKLLGQHLYEYRDKIYAFDSDKTVEDFFLTNDYDKEMKESADQGRVELSKAMIPKVKDAWKGLTDAEKKVYKDAIVGLLDDYIEYLCLAGGS